MINASIYDSDNQLVFEIADEVDTPINEQSTILNYFKPIQSNAYRIELILESNAFYGIKKYTLERDNRLPNQKIGDAEIGYIDLNQNIQPFVRYVNVLKKDKPIGLSLTAATHDTVKVILKKLLADNEYARPIHARQYNSTSITFRGLDDEKSEILLDTLFFTKDFENKAFQVNLSQLGNYELELFAKDSENSTYKKTYAKHFALFDSEFPHKRTLRSILESYAYILPEGTYNKIMGENNAEIQEKLFVDYFTSSIDKPKDIRDVLAKYSSRVVEANYFFTNFKEGWKTDMGMIYIIFGPPLFVTRQYDFIYWHYTHEPNDPQRVFRFRRVRLNSRFFPFDHYLVSRSSSYFQINYSRVNDWRTGAILYYDRF